MNPRGRKIYWCNKQTFFVLFFVKLFVHDPFAKGGILRAGVLPQDYDFEAHKKLVPMQPGDVPTTYADASALERDFGFTPKITLREGLRKFAEWYAEYYLKGKK